MNTSKIAQEKRARGARPSGFQALKYTLFAAEELFALVSLLRFLIQHNRDSVLLSLATVLLAALPLATERIFRVETARPLYLLEVFYTLCPLLGHSYKLYYLIPWWDKLLHCMGGAVFAIVGLYLAPLCNRGHRTSRLLCAVFALCLSIAVAAVWEFYEFTSDRLLGTDTQNDAYITSLHSHLLDDSLGGVGAIEEIREVTVNGVVLDGYIDIGLIDTMEDMMIETLGAVIAVLAYALLRGRHPAFRRRAPAPASEKEGSLCVTELG